MVLAWKQGKMNATDPTLTTNYEVFYKELTNNNTGATVFDNDKVKQTNQFMKYTFNIPRPSTQQYKS